MQVLLPHRHKLNNSYERARPKLSSSPHISTCRPSSALILEHQATAVAQPAVRGPEQAQSARQIDSRGCNGNMEQPYSRPPDTVAGDGRRQPRGAGPRWEGQPQHIALIMDGNGRWARERGLPPSRGHEAGVVALQNAIQCCLRWRIPALTVRLPPPLHGNCPHQRYCVWDGRQASAPASPHPLEVDDCSTLEAVYKCGCW